MAPRTLNGRQREVPSIGTVHISAVARDLPGRSRTAVHTAQARALGIEPSTEGFGDPLAALASPAWPEGRRLPTMRHSGSSGGVSVDVDTTGLATGGHFRGACGVTWPHVVGSVPCTPAAMEGPARPSRGLSCLLIGWC